MGNSTLRFLKEAIGGLIESGKAKPEDFHVPFLEFVLQMIDVGPTSSHVEYISNLNDSSVEFYKYLSSLRGEGLRRVIRALMKQYKQDPGSVWGRYEHNLERFIRIFTDRVFCDEQREEGHRDFIDLYMYFITAFNTREENIRKKMQSCAHCIEHKYDRNNNIFKGIRDVGLLKRHLAAMREVMLAPEYPQAPDVGEKSKDMVCRLLQTVSDELLIGEMYEEIMDFALQLTIKKSGSKAAKDVFERIGYFFYHLKKECIENNNRLFEGLVVKLTQLVSNIGDETFLDIFFAGPIVAHVLCAAMGTSRDHAVLWIEMIKALLKHPRENCLNAAWDAIRNTEKVLKWKEHPGQVKEIFAILIKVTDLMQDEDKKKAFSHLKYFTDRFLTGVNKAKLQKDIKEDMVFLIFHCIELHNETLYELAYEVVSKLELSGKTDKDLIMKIIHFLDRVLADESYGWIKESTPYTLPNTAQRLIQGISTVKDGKTFTLEELEDMVSLCLRCQQGAFVRDDDSLTAYFFIYLAIAGQLYQWLDSMNEIHRVKRLLPGVIDMLESDNDTVRNTGSFQVQTITRSGSVGEQYMVRLIQIYLETELDGILWAISYIYEKNPGALAPYFQDLFQHIDSGNVSAKSSIRMLLQKVAKYQPDLFTQENMETMMKEAREDSTQQVLILMAMEEITKRRPEKLTPFIEQLTTPDLWNSNCAYTISSMLQHYAVKHEGEGSSKVMDYMIKVVQTSSDKVAVGTALNSIRLIGFKHRPLLEKYRGVIEKFRDTTKDNDHHSGCSLIIDLLDGKSLDKVAAEVKALQEDVVDLEVRVITVETDVVEVKGSVRRQEKDLDKVKDEVAEHGQRLDQVEDTVEETVAKVEEIDGKTLSHAPFWSRDVSKLLNPDTKHDWRLLGRRLGYNNDDMRGWAQQADPCMAMLNEWYATHKTRDATFAVLTALQDMSREDAAAIVENAMKNAEAVVEDEEFEYATPPDVFISYQWGHQNEVRLLRQHLEMAGYSCWMDVGQMGGGDKLFEKIDSGIRGAKVVICCVNEKYSKSPNCNREVNLTVSLGKPIIPLLMEQTTWPPPGSMGPIFSEYLFIRFFQRSGEETTDSRYWPLSKFQELLMQLSMNAVMPDEAAVQPEYKNWWVPKTEDIKVDKNRKNGNSKTSAIVTNQSFDKVTVSPDVFISYQWGRQPQVVRLYKALTSQGFTCWLDIMQMGGGDSLFDKIDKGVRGCRVVVSCVTPKYALSANCRREVSLADALKKPLVPLLLETTSWPPPGPMGPVLTQLLYIDYTDPTLQEKWTGPKFQELVAKIRENVPTHDSSANSLSQGQLHTKSDAPQPADESRGKPASLPTANPEVHDPPHQQLQGCDPQPVERSLQDRPPPPHSPDAKEAPQVASSSCCLIQ
ncbi:uncharacterized protein LOC112554278 isoform X2 [Pomacea canaliculata]|uniref:uncharacterized protein LOC112554278 isoform X2 n=1 Tax=Pomacea canaliculata TaxID=400727 RepID=UPI000D73942C|nr:uncharacterized protein LOC112554278 isoform X2 [Pomacea canaliculata]